MTIVELHAKKKNRLIKIKMKTKRRTNYKYGGIHTSSGKPKKTKSTDCEVK